MEMSDQRRRILALSREVDLWRIDHSQTSSRESKKVHNQLCETLDACNEWLSGYEGGHRIVGNVEMGPIPVTWQRIP
jgi:hypothetical protein